MNLYIISSPFQLACAIESSLQLDTNCIFWIFLGKTKKVNNLMISLCESYISKNKVHYLDYRKPVILLISKIKQLKILNQSYDFDKIFIGNLAEFSEKLIAININHKELWSLDDGAKTLVLNKTHCKETFKIKPINQKMSISNIVKNIIITVYSLRKYRIEKVNWFTIFDFVPNNNGKIVTHQLSYLKRKMNYIEVENSSNKEHIYFIGTNLINTGVIENADNYFQQLKTIIENYSKNIVIYVPHRLESKKDLLTISTLGFKIKEFDNIIEIAFLKNKIYPHTIISFYSTALYSLSKLFPKTRVEFIELNPQFIAPKFLENIEIVQKEYKSIFG